MREDLPPGPRWPSAVQGAAFWTRPLPFLERSILASCEVKPASGVEVARRRNITIKPGAGARTVLTTRCPAAIAIA